MVRNSLPNLESISQLVSSGGSSGGGVFRNTMTALMDSVFADQTIWKAVDSGHVIDVTPAGIISDPTRLRRLRAYGYACMLYILREHSLPVPMSTVFAYALLLPNGDVSVLDDADYLRAAAPGEARLLNEWPSDATAFIERKDDPILRELTLEYFNKSVSRSLIK